MAFTGTCKSFKPEKGFGFILSAEGTDVFLHIKACSDGCYPVQGDTLTFDIEDSAMKPGQIQASNVTGGTGGGKGGSGKGAKSNHVATGTLTGAVKSFAPSKGYGFLIGPDGTDIFLHVRAMADGSVPTKGDTLSYDAEPSPTNPGQMVAKNCAGGTGWPIEKGGGKDGGYGKGDGGWGGKDGPYGKGGDSWGGKGDSWGGKGDSWGGDGGGKGKMGKMMDMMMSCMDSWGGGGDSWGGKGEGGGKGKGKGGWGGDGGW